VVVVADVNAVWRSRPFGALARRRPVLGLRPMDSLIALRAGKRPWGTSIDQSKGLPTLSMVLPFGWATRRADKSMRSIWSHAVKACRKLGHKPSALVVTSPHYAKLVDHLPRGLPSFYYCSDDYLSYKGWDVEQMRAQETRLLSMVRHAFFVSEALRQRAIRDNGADSDKTSVSRNATGPTFARAVDEKAITELFRLYPRLKRPVAGVIGSISERLDLGLLLEVASLEEIGALALVGSLDATKHNRQLEELLRHPKVVSVGKRPQDSMPVWHHLMDIALIPYSQSLFNYYCSPLRLFDHLASGRPIVATSACPQVLEFADYVTVGRNESEFVDAVRRGLTRPRNVVRTRRQREIALEETWAFRAAAIDQMIG
jgi:hypothetical protein